MGRTPAHACHTQTSYALYWSSRDHPGTPMPPISVRGNEPDHPLLGECITHPTQSWPSSDGRPPNRGDSFQRPSTCIASVTLGTDWGVFPVHRIWSAILVDTLRVAHEGAPPGYPTASPSHGAPSTFMELLSQMIHSWLETPRTPSHLQGASTFREPYPVTNLPTAPATFVHSPDPRPASGDSQLVATTCMFMQAEEEYLCTFRPMTSTPSNAPSTPHHLFSATPQQQLMHTPVWPAAQSGPQPPMPPMQPAPLT